MRLSKIELVLLPFVIVLGYLIVSALFYRLGFFGLGLLGLIVGFIAVTVELEGDGPVGGNQNADLFSQNFRGRLLQSRAERDERYVRRRQAMLPLHVAKVASSGLIIIGFGCSYLFQFGN